MKTIAILAIMQSQRSINMPGSVRPNPKAMKIAYDILKTPKERRQQTQPKPSDKQIKEWWRDSSTAQ